MIFLYFWTIQNGGTSYVKGVLDPLYVFSVRGAAGADLSRHPGGHGATTPVLGRAPARGLAQVAVKPGHIWPGGAFCFLWVQFSRSGPLGALPGAPIAMATLGKAAACVAGQPRRGPSIVRVAETGRAGVIGDTSAAQTAKAVEKAATSAVVCPASVLPKLQQNTLDTACTQTETTAPGGSRPEPVLHDDVGV